LHDPLDRGIHVLVAPVDAIVGDDAADVGRQLLSGWPGKFVHNWNDCLACDQSSGDFTLNPDCVFVSFCNFFFRSKTSIPINFTGRLVSEEASVEGALGEDEHKTARRLKVLEQVLKT